MAKIVLENRTLPTNDPSPNDPSRRRDFGVTGEAGWASRQIERHRELEAPASGPARDEPRQVSCPLASLQNGGIKKIDGRSQHSPKQQQKNKI